MVVLSAVLMTAALLALWRGFLWQGRPLPGVQRAPPLLVGHRGVRGPLPENTLAAFRLALESGLDGLETDVQRTRDGVLVLVHDTIIDGVAVTAWRHRQLRERVTDLATLEELFALVRAHPGVWLNLELKTVAVHDVGLASAAAGALRTNGLAVAVARALRASGLEDRTVVSSFDPIALARLRLEAPLLRTGYLWESEPKVPWPMRSPWPAGWLHVDALHPRWSSVDAALVARARRRGLAVNVWTVNDAAEVRRLKALGVSGIMADDPDALVRAGRGGEG